MAGTLTISTLSDGTNSTSSTNCIQGSAKAWVRFTGSTGAIIGSYNVSSITRSSTGVYFVNFTNALSNANYAVSVPLGFISASNYCSTLPFLSSPGSVTYTAPTTSGFYISAAALGSGTANDPTVVMATVFSS